MIVDKLIAFFCAFLGCVAVQSTASYGYTPAAMPTNQALQGAATITYPGGLTRDTFGNNNGAPPLYYMPSNAACSLNAGAGDNGSQVKSADGKCWLAQFPDNTMDVRQFGAISGVDASAQLTAALTVCGGGRKVLVPITLTVNNPVTAPTSMNCELRGNGRWGVSMINPGATFPAGAELFNFIGPTGQPATPPVDGTNSFAIRDLAFNCAAATNMNSYAIHIAQTSSVIIDSVYIYKCPKQFDLLNDGNVYVNNLTSFDLAPVSGLGFQINIIGEFRAQNFYYDNDAPGGSNTDGSVYFNFVAGSGFAIDNGTILHVRDGVIIAPQGGVGINAFVIGDGVYIDQTSDVAMRVQPAGAGNTITNGIIGGHLWTGVGGLYINTNGGGIGDVRVRADFYNFLENAIDIQGTPQEISLEAVRANGYGCATSGTANTSATGNVVTLVSQTGCGLNVTWGGQPITINGVNYTINTVTNATQFTLTTGPGNQTGVAYSFAPAASGGAGVNIGANVPNLYIRDSQLGPGGFISTSRGWGIYNGSANITLILHNNDLRQNSVAAINTVLCGGGCRFEGNSGLNPIGTTDGITVGASPDTICSGPAWETHYFLQGAPNTATIAIGGTVVGTTSSATLPVVTTLGPGECEVVSWISTPPTYNKSVH